MPRAIVYPHLTDDDVPHQPRRGDDVEAWLKRQRDACKVRTDIGGRAAYRAIDDLLNRYRECNDYGLTLRPDDDGKGDR